MFTFINKNSIYFFVFFVCFSFKSFSNNALHSEKEVAVALRVLEKAILLSPEFFNQSENHSIVPFYEINGYKIYLNEGFWNLTRAWLKSYMEEVEKYCSCDLDPNLMIQEAKDYLPQALLKKKILNWSQNSAYTVTHLASRYGYTAAVLKLSAEVAETLLFIMTAGIGAHVLCNAIDVMIFPLVRKVQKHVRVFSYGGQIGTSRMFSSAKMVWLSRQIRKSKKRVFFHIKQALVFREQELEKINKKGPKSLFHKRGHRLLWIEQLKEKTDPLFEQIKEWELQLQDNNFNLKEQNKIAKNIKKARKKIETISKVNRKDFFGMRFKRFLFLKSRKGRIAYMSANDLPDKTVKKNILWPLSLQENIIGGALESNFSEVLSKEEEEVKPDDIRNGLIEEFLSRRQEVKEPLQSERELTDKKQAVQDLLLDIDKIFNTEVPSSIRLIKAQAIEAVLGNLFTLSFKILSSSVLSTELSEKYNMSFSERIKMQWVFGRFFYLAYEFSDFLSIVSITKDKTKIQFYKYESMEKLLAFLDYLYEFQILLKKGDYLDKPAVFEKLASREHKLRTISLLKNKKATFSFLPFKKGTSQCEKLVEKYQ